MRVIYITYTKAYDMIRQAFFEAVRYVVDRGLSKRKPRNSSRQNNKFQAYFQCLYYANLYCKIVLTLNNHKFSIYHT
jgi:hypothetical protein